MEFKVNLLNEFLKIRNGYFTSINTVLDELIQNSQRSKSTEIIIRFNEDSIAIKDNGCGCDNVEALLTKSQSGWNTEVMQSDNPAGEGFYSTGMIANKVIFKSKIALEFDFGKLFNDKSLDIVTKLNTTINNGTEIILSDFHNNTINNIQSEWLEYAKYNLEFVPLTIKFIIGEDLEYIYGNKYDAFLKNQSIVFKTEAFDYILDLFGANHNCTKVYYQSRFVCELGGWPNGLLYIKDNKALDVRLPDRKDIVENHKINRLENDVTNLVLNYIANNIKYTDINENVKYYLQSVSSYRLYEAFKNIPIAYDCNNSKDITFEDFRKYEESNNPLYYVDRFEMNQDMKEIVKNNLYYNNQVFDIIYPFRYAIRNKFNVNFTPATFSGFHKSFEKIADHTTVDFIKYISEFTDFLSNKGFDVPDYIIEVGIYIDANKLFPFQGLCANNKISILTEIPVNLKGKKRCHQFMLEHLDTIIHEFTHLLYKSEDETATHYRGMVTIYKYWNLYLNFNN